MLLNLKVAKSDWKIDIRNQGGVLTHDALWRKNRQGWGNTDPLALWEGFMAEVKF